MAFIESGKSFDKEENHDKMKKRMGSMDTKQYPLRIPSDLYKKVRMKLIKEDRNLRSVLIEMLEEYINK
jgi:hypothetical protein